MSLTHFFTFFILLAVLESVFGATCKNSTACIETTYTSTTCDMTSKICSCKNETVPIPTGCGPKLSAPTLSQPAGYSTVVLDGKTATLTCTSQEDATLFEWTLNNNVIALANTSTYTTGAITASANLGPYRCKAKISGMNSLDSDQSDPITFVVLAKTDTSSSLSINPTISLLPTSTVFKGKSVPVSCTDIPIGYDTNKVVITDNNGKVTSPVTINDVNAGQPVKCELTDYPASHATKIVGPITNLPTLVSELSTPTTISTTAENNDVYTKDTPITLKCLTSPDVPYVDTTVKPITFAWMRDTTVLTAATTQTFVLPQEEGSYTIKCQANTTTSGTPIQSPPITIVRNSNYLTKPIITINPTNPAIGSRFTLTCGNAGSDMYSWKKDNTVIVRQFDRIIQLDNVTTSDNGDYVCTARKSKVTQISDAFNVKVGSGQEVVKVSMIVLGLTLLMSKVFA